MSAVEKSQKIHVAFDGIIFPLEKALVAVEAEEGPVQGAGITWATIDGQTVVTVEFCLRGKDPVHISFVEQEDGRFEVLTPSVYLPNPREF